MQDLSVSIQEPGMERAEPADCMPHYSITNIQTLTAYRKQRLDRMAYSLSAAGTHSG